MAEEGEQNQELLLQLSKQREAPTTRVKGFPSAALAMSKDDTDLGGSLTSSISMLRGCACV